MAGDKHRATTNRRIRQQALREQLAEQARVQHILTNLQKIESLDPSSKDSMNELQILKVANEQRFRLLNKYLPDLSNVTLSADEENPLVSENKFIVEVISAASSDTGEVTAASEA